MLYLDNTKQLQHNLTELQKQLLQPTLEEIDFVHYDMSGRPTTSSHDYISHCFKASAQIGLDDTNDIKHFDAYKYFRSMVCNITDYEIVQEYNIMIRAFNFGAEMIAERLKKKS